MKIDVAAVRKCLKSFDFATLFREHLGWDKHQATLDVPVDGTTIRLTAVAQKRGFSVYVCEAIPDRPTRLKIDHQVTKSAREHFVIYTNQKSGQQVWQWVRREPGKPLASRDHRFDAAGSGDALIQRLEHIAVGLDEEEAFTLVQASSRAKKAFDVETVTKKFYDRFKTEHAAFLKFINGIKAEGDLQWYTSLMLNRLMFVYFVQKKGFLDNDSDYLRNRMRQVRELKGKDKFQSFYRYFLVRLFHDGLGKHKNDRKLDRQLEKLLGSVPYLNGGFFEVHQLEERNADIDIPDKAFERLFDFFDEFRWHLDERPLREGNEINPDVVGYIFEKYINQKQMGAYYTKEDITEYISKNTIVPFLFDAAQKKCPIAFKPESFLWRLLREDPDRYIYAPVRHGVVDSQGNVVPLPKEIAAGIKDVAKREGWNRAAVEPFALPTETWREYVARRQRCLELREKLRQGEVHAINDLITFNLDIWQFARDVIVNSEGPELLRAFWQAIAGRVPEKSNEKFEPGITVLDPTCGSGAFLFAALRILETLYSDCLERMERFVEDQPGGTQPPEKFSDFKRILAQIAKHPNERYFVLKSIIIGNLFGVDIMEEAVEICKLRLFLKLVAQVERVEQIEPLPDIDFNIRAGNTLVGYVSLDEVKKSQAGTLGFGASEIKRIEEDALAVEKCFEQFRAQQTTHGGKVTAKDKTELRSRLTKLDSELDRFLAGEYGIDAKGKNGAAFDKWKATHQPFHWFVEFYGIMSGGGFDVIIGNPPYVEYSKVKSTYQMPKFEALGNLHAMVTLRSIALAHPFTAFSMIVPVALPSTDRFDNLRAEMCRHSVLWVSHFDFRPSKLFEGANQRLTIFVRRHGEDKEHFTTRYNRWSAEERATLFQRLQFTVLLPAAHSPRRVWSKNPAGSCSSVLVKVVSGDKSVSALLGNADRHSLFYKNTGMLYYTTFTRVAPKCFINGTSGASSRETRLKCSSDSAKKILHALLNSTMFYLQYQVYSNCRDLNPSDITAFRFPSSVLTDARFSDLSDELHKNQQDNSHFIVRNQKLTGEVRLQSFKPKASKSIIDEIDALLGKHFLMSDEEIDSVVNYDIKYRLGQEESDDEQE